ncbi:MAG: HAMP domain-containing sensor histidine kinase [Bryobacteraceae bacterium]
MNGVVDDQTLCLLAPRIGSVEAGGFPRVSLSGWSVAELDSAFLESEYLPELASKHFGGHQALNCNLQVVGNTDPAKIFFELDKPQSGALLQQPDATAPLLEVRPNPLGRGPGAMLGPPGFRPPLLAGDPPGPLWRLLVKHRAGSLEASVEDVRRRNLLVSFAILLLMGASMAMLFVSTRRAQRLAELQMEFVAGVSHELRTPLTVICSAGENLADGVVASEERRRRYGAVIRDEGRRLSQMVEEILAFAGAQSGSASKSFQPVEISELLDRAVAACGPAFRDHGCEVERHIAVDLPQVLGDATSLTHALRNLLSNALKYGSDRSSIAVWAQANGGKHPTVEIRIEDKGTGIDPADLPYIFEPFYRGARAKEDQIPGAGLGLSLVKRILEAHGGSVHASNESDGGASFTLTLPAAPEPELENGR